MGILSDFRAVLPMWHPHVARHAVWYKSPGRGWTRLVPPPFHYLSNGRRTRAPGSHPFRPAPADPGYSPDLLLKLKADYPRGPITHAVYAHYVSGMHADWDFVAGPTPGVTQRIGERVDGYWNVGVNLRYEHPGSGFYANLNASNVLDAEIRYPANQLADFTRGLIGPGPVVTATVGWKF